MMIWRLHRALNYPPLAAAIIRRSYAYRLHRYDAPVVTPPLITALANFMRGVGLVILPIGALLFGAPLLVLFMFLVFALSPLLVPLSHVIYGMIIAFNVSGKIAREHEQGTYDLLSTLPTGGIGLHWSIMTSWLVDHRAYRQFTFVMILIGIAAAVFGGMSLFKPVGVVTSSALFWIASSAALSLILLVDHLGTPVIAALISMIAAVNTTNVINARMGAIAAFVAVQVSAYLIGVFTAAVLMPAVFVLFPMSDALFGVLLTMLTLIAFAGFREYTVRRLWRALRHTINASPAEMDALC